MSDIVGGKAIALVQRGGVRELHRARVFEVQGSGGNTYTVTLGTQRRAPDDTGPRYRCTCPASARCYHGDAALLLAAQRPAVDLATMAYEQREQAAKDGWAMTVAGSTEQRAYAPEQGPGVTAAVAYVVHATEMAKRLHLGERHQAERDEAAQDAELVAAVFEQGADELRRVAQLLRGPMPQAPA